MAKKNKKGNKGANAKQNGRRLPAAPLESDLSSCAPVSEDTPMIDADGTATEKQGKSMDSERAPCKHLGKGVNCRIFVRRIENSQVLKCKGCAKSNESDSKNKKVKKGKSKSSTKKGRSRSNDMWQPEDDWPRSTWVCLSCGFIGCGSIPDSFEKGGNKENGLKLSSEEAIDRGHAWQHFLGLNHPCAMQCGDRILFRCFLCKSTLQYDFSKASNGKDKVIDCEGDWSLSILQAWKAVQEKLVKESSTVNGICSVMNKEIRQEKSGTVLIEDKADGLVLCGRVIKGLMNLGNTCFFNSVLQNMLALDELRDHFTQPNVEFLGQVSLSLRNLYMETSLERQQGDKAKELDSCLLNANTKKGRRSRMPPTSGKGVISPGSLFNAICAKAPRFRGFQQQDSHELLKYLLDSLKTEESNESKLQRKQLNKSPGESDNEQLSSRQFRTHMHTNERNSHSDTLTLVDSIFGGQLSSTVRCCVCGFSSVMHEPFLDLSLPIPRNEMPKRSSIRGQNKFASASTLEKCSPKKQLQKDASKERKKQGKKSQVSPMTKSEAKEMIVCSGKFSSAASVENIIPDTPNGPTTRGDPEQLNCLLPLKQSAEGPCQSTFDLSETMERIEESDVKSIDCNCNGILLDNSETISVKQTSNNISICQNGHNVDENTIFSPSENAMVMQSHSDCQDRSAIYNNEKNGEFEEEDKPFLVADKDFYNGLNAGEGVGVGTTNDSELFTRSNTSKDCHKHFDVKSVLAMDSEHVPMECDGIELVDQDTPSSEKQQEEKCEVENNICQENGRQDICEAETNAATERSNMISTEVFSNAIVPMSIDGCFTSFTRPELLSGDNAWECDGCSARFGNESSNDKTARLEDAINMKFSAALDFEGGQDKTIHKRGTHIENDKNPSQSCAKEDKEFDGTKKLSSLNDQGSGQLSSPQKQQMGTVDFGSCDIVQENEINFRPKRVATRSSLRMAERIFKESGDLKEDFAKVDVHQQKGFRSCGRKQKMENIDAMGTNLEPKRVKRDATKQYLISKAPNVLIVHLKRFTQDLRGRLSKLSGHVTFQDKLDLSPYLDPKCTERESSIYSLTGVVEHLGSMKGGHYVAYVRGPQEEKQQDIANDDCTGQSRWYYISDAHVSKSSLLDVLGSEAYLLFYQKF
ncbi:ubiquitin carboxyl-terminal hydrolase 2 isoform X1 [Cryptomeria japonica]|uniref:ubiquitin carboxyl-terminal hydrolase 2 isoform X1 n=1 Tax=Cryptomeria japonica TaxID=3369 RepID=UPI0025AC8DE1|nr:ubiquitin carboxyl-terminal hydrolase 2 isoform X1 [Cryptomeria japonica]